MNYLDTMILDTNTLVRTTGAYDVFLAKYGQSLPPHSNGIFTSPVQAAFSTCYPNPNNGICTIYVAGSNNNVLKINVYDQSGRLVQSSSGIFNGRFEVNMQAYTKGIYYYTITDNKQLLTTGKIVYAF